MPGCWSDALVASQEPYLGRDHNSLSSSDPTSFVAVLCSVVAIPVAIGSGSRVRTPANKPRKKVDTMSPLGTSAVAVIAGDCHWPRIVKNLTLTPILIRSCSMQS